MISKEEEAYLLHYGVKGMKWGVRKDRGPGFRERAFRESPGVIKTRVVSKTGDVLSIEKQKISAVGTAFGKALHLDPARRAVVMHIRTAEGKKAGEFQLWFDNKEKTTVRGEWLSIDKEYQGRGYSEAALRGLILASRKDKRIREARMQVPTTSEAAKHIYTKLGFAKDLDLGDGLEDWVYRVR